MSDDKKNQKELQRELAEEAREEQEDLSSGRSEEREDGKIFETVNLPADEINAALEEGEAAETAAKSEDPGLENAEDDAFVSEDSDETIDPSAAEALEPGGEGGPEKEEKILETVTLPTDEINAELEREQNEEIPDAEPERNEEDPVDLEFAAEPDEERDGNSSAENAESVGESGPRDDRESSGRKRNHNPFRAIRHGFGRLKVWQRVIAAVLIAVIAVVAAGYGYFHSKYSLMDYNTGEFHSDESIASASEQSTQDALENEELEKRQLVEEIPEQSVVESTQEVEKASGVINILLIGTDDRTKKFSKNARGDTCILLSINNDQNKAHLVSFERATGVKVLSGEYEGQWDWLTHMFWYGGPAMMTEEIRDNFKVDVTKYIRVNIYTFMELLDSIDGVDIELTQAEADNLNHPGNTYTAGNEKRAIALGYPVQTDLTAGMNHLDPGTAMCYARLRAIDDDWHRVVRQRNVILAAISKLKTMNVTELDNLLNNVLPLVQTNLTEADVAGLIPEALDFVNMEYDSITFPLRHTYGLMDGMQGRKVLAVDFDTNSQELQDLLYGDATTGELTEKYENKPSDYNYKDSNTYQKNYKDAETSVGKSTNTANDTGVSSRSGAVSGTTAAGITAGTTGSAAQPAGMNNAGGISSGAGTAAAQPAGAAASASGTGAAGTSAGTSPASSGTAGGSSAASGSSGLGKVISSTTDPATGVVTTIYYNEATGVRTVTATHPASGATTVSTTDTATGNTQTVHKDAYGNVTTETSNTGVSAAAGTAGNGSGTPAGAAANGTGAAAGADANAAAAQPAQ